MKKTVKVATVKSPFFIVGCGRSGTSLLRTMLNHHPQIAIPLESLFIIDYLRAPKEVSLNTLKKLIIHEPEIEEWGLRLTSRHVGRCKSRKELIDKINILYMEKNKKIIWGQKTPRFIRYWKLLKKTYPRSKFIHLIRDPRANVNSLIKSNVHFSNCLYASKRWNMDVSCGLEMKKKYPKDVLEVKYSDLINNPKKELLRVCKFLGINYNSKIMRYSNTGHKEYLPYFNKIHRYLNRKPDTTLIDKWKKELLMKEIEVIESINQNLMKRLGFELIHAYPKKNKILILEMRIQRICGLVKQIVAYLRFRRKFFIYNLKRKNKLGYLSSDLKSINY